MNADKVVACNVIRYDAGKNIFVADKKLTSVEKSFELRLNGESFKKVFCSPEDLEDLTIGLLAQAYKISSAADVTYLVIDNNSIEVETRAGVQVVQQVSSDVKFIAKDILACADKLLGELSTTHDKTNGVHNGLLFDGQNILLFREDIGRHNVFDKIYGAALRQNIDLSDKMIIFSGRCSCEMISKVAHMKIPVVVAKSVPTSYSINIAKKFGITLAGRLRADSFCIYSEPERIVLS